MSSLMRPATPGFLVTLAATVLLALTSFSVPLIKSVYFLKASLAADNINGDITLGTLGYCTYVGSSTTCSSPSVGYQFDVNALVGDTTVQIPQVVIKWLTYVLVLHIVAFGLAALSALLGLLAHVREMAMSCFSSCISGFAASVTLVAFIFDIAIFVLARSRMNSVQGGSASIGNAVWLTLAALVLLFFSGCFYTIGRCCIRRRPRDAWGGKAGTPIGLSGYNTSDQLRLDAVKAEADRKARQAQHEVGLPAFHEYDPSQPLQAHVDGDEVYLEETVPYRDNQSISTSGNASMGSYDRSRARYAGGGYMQAPLGTRAVDEYNNPSSYPPRQQRQGSNMTHSPSATPPSMYSPSSNVLANPSTDSYYNHDPYSPQAYGHNLGGSSYIPHTQQSNVPSDSYGAFAPNSYNTTATMAHNPPQSPYGVPHNPPDRSYTLGGGAYGAATMPGALTHDPYGDPYYGHYQAPSNPTSSPMSQPSPSIDARTINAPTPISPTRGPRGPRNSIVMAPPPTSPAQYADSPPTYEPGPSGPGQWDNKSRH